MQDASGDIAAVDVTGSPVCRIGAFAKTNVKGIFSAVIFVTAFSVEEIQLSVSINQQSIGNTTVTLQAGFSCFCPLLCDFQDTALNLKLTASADHLCICVIMGSLSYGL